MKIEIEIRGKGIATFTAAAQNLSSDKMRSAARMALNDTGRKVNTQVKRELAGQTGLRGGVVQKSLRNVPASNARLEYTIVGTGKHFGLTDFGARQTKAGVSAAPWGTRRIFKRTFFVKRLGNQVFVRKGQPRFPIKKLFGPAIPREMVRGEVARVFEVTSRTFLLQEVRRQIGRLMPK